MLAALLVAPLFMGWINQCRAWLQNRSAPSLLQPYRGIRKLFHKDAVLASNASPLFRMAPYVVFGTMVCAAAIIPSLGTRLPFSNAADAIALVGLFATARVFMSLAAMDVGTAFGTLGARREMLVGFLAEPALLMVIFLASLISASTALPAISEDIATRTLALYPSLAFTAVAFLLVLLAENARIPVDNPGHTPRAHDDPRGHAARVFGASPGADGMVGGAQVVELCVHRFRPVPALGSRDRRNAAAWLAAQFDPDSRAQVDRGAGLLALIETVSAKLRIFRAPEFLATAFLFAVLGLLVHLLLGA